MTKRINVTSPLLPPLEEFIPYLEKIWDNKWLTNNGEFHQKLESELCKYLGVDYISLFCNGTQALIVALQALNLSGEVITTPYSFVATSNALLLNNLKPVFIDIDPKTMNLDPSLIEAAITDKTTAILPVHVYGTPCDNNAIQAIADKYNLKVIYDAAHAFGVKKDGASILNWGDLSILSFHATKAYSTIEGGAIICHSLEMKQKLDQLKNFGFTSETEVSMLGTNAKMNEIQAAFGLANLKHIDEAIKLRAGIANLYRKELNDVPGLSFLKPDPTVEYNYSYFPIIIDEEVFGISRDDLYEKLAKNNIYCRKYFYPLISDFLIIKSSTKQERSSIRISKSLSNKVLCLPISQNISSEDTMKIVDLILESNI